MALRIIFMGTPEFAVPSLERLAGAGHELLVVTQPGRPAGRGLRVEPSPVARVAAGLGLTLLERGTLRGDEAVAPLVAFRPDLLVVVAFGLILRRRVLGLPRLLPVNLHPSLLPRHRGVAPIPWTILAGDRETGVATIRMDEGIDTGDLLDVERTPVGGGENAVELAARLAVLGAEVLVTTVAGAGAQTLDPRPQGETGATVAPRLTKEHGLIDWCQPAAWLERLVRAVAGWPGARATCGEEVIEIVAAEPVAGDVGEARPGTILVLDERGMEVATAAGRLRIRTVKPAGKREMSAAAFARGRRVEVGRVLGSLPGAEAAAADLQRASAAMLRSEL